MQYKTVNLKDGQVVVLSELEEADLLELVRVLNGVVREGRYLLVDEEAVADFEAERQRLLKRRSEGTLDFVAKVDGKIVGAARLMPFTGKRAHVAQLAMYLDKHHRNLGLGTAMIRELVNATGERGFEVLQVSAFSTNQRAMHVYEKCGFQQCGRLRHDVKFSDGTYADMVMFEMILR